MNDTLKASLAVTAAALFIAGCSKAGAAPEAVTAAEEAGTEAMGEEVKCMGVNECKGTGACGVPGGHSCAGQNECKGKGWIKTTAEDCVAKAGSVL